MPNSEDKKYVRLQRAGKISRENMRTSRETRYAISQQLAGYHYSENAAPDKVPVNMLRLHLDILMSQLVPRGPRPLVTSQYQQLRPHAHVFGLSLVEALEELRYEEKLRICVQDALVGPMGIMKIAYGDGGSINLDGKDYRIPKTYNAVIDFDDWTHDMSASDLRQGAFMGHRDRVPLMWAKENKAFSKVVREKLNPTHRMVYDDNGDKRLKSMSNDGYEDQDEYQDYVEIQEFWLPDDNQIYVCPVVETGLEKPLQIIDWDGPDTGPYHFLYFNTVPGQVMPVSPLNQLYDLHTSINRLTRKTIRQAERAKTVLPVKTTEEENAKAVVESIDGQCLLVTNNPQEMREMKFGQVDPVNIAVTDNLLARYNTQAGNLESIGGLGAAADTVGQEKIIKASSSGIIQGLQYSVNQFSKGNMEAIAFYEWNDPLLHRQLSMQLDGYKGDIPVEFSVEKRQGRFRQYKYDIVPYSFQEQTPSQRMQAIDQLFTNIIIPLMPMMQQAGIVPDLQKYIRLRSEYLNMPEILDLLSMTDKPPPEQAEDGQGMERPRQSPVTTRNYNRASQSGNPQATQQNALMQSAIGKAVREGV